MQPYFRDAVHDDIPAIAAILRQLTLDHTPAHGAGREPLDQLGSFRDALIEIDRTDGNYVLVAELGGSIAAVIQLVTFRQLHLLGGRVAEVVALRVADTYRTTGIAGMLLDHAERRARDLGCRRLQVLVNTADNDEGLFWERYGFVPTERGYIRAIC